MKNKIFFVVLPLGLSFFIFTIPLIQASLIENVWYNTLTFLGIIEITKANHLNSDRIVISNIYEQVKSLDNLWGETINNNDYVRVTFEKNLTSQNDITIYPKIISGNPRIEVYEINSNEKIAEFSSLNSNKYNKILLTNLQNSQDTFDLKIVDGDIEINHIIDPPPIILTKIDRPVTFCGEITNSTTIWINASGVLNICPYTGTNGTGYVNISLGIYGNFTLEAGGQIRGNGTGGIGGVSTSSGNATQGTDGNKSKVGTTSRLNNGGGGGGGEDLSTGDSAGGCGGGFGGAGGIGGRSDGLGASKNCTGGIAYNGTNPLRLLIGSGGGGESGDNNAAASGGAGGGGLKISAGSGVIQITGLINVSGKPGVATDGGDDSGGGGGSGGHVILNATTLNLNSGTIYAVGGKGGAGAASGSDSCGGGGGGGGVIVYLYGTVSNTGLTNDTSGGALGGATEPGCSQSNATAYKDTAGSAGIVLYNMTSFPAVDLTDPAMSIAYPSNASNFSYSISVNYTVSNINLDKCWWTNDSGLTNKSITCGTNITGQGWIEGINNVTVYANDTWYNENSTSVTFRLDTQPPYFNEILPNITVAEGSAVGSDINATDDNVGLQSYAVNDTTNFKINSSGYLENKTVLSTQKYYLNISVNDLVGNVNSSLMFVDVISANTCTPPGSGNWAITCSDACVWNVNQNIPWNITATGTGILTLNANFIFTGTKQYVFINPGCKLNINPGGGFA